MGDRGSEGEIWDLTLQLEGLSLRLSRTRFPNPNPAGPPAPVQSTREESPSARSLAYFSVVSGSASEPAPPFSLSGASVSNLEPRSRGLATGSSPLRDSPSTPQEGPCHSGPSGTAVPKYPLQGFGLRGRSLPGSSPSPAAFASASSSAPAPGLSHFVGSPSCPAEGLSSSPSAAPAVPEYPLPGPRAQTFEQRQLLALSFCPVPDTCVALCKAFDVGELTAAERADRAWVAGCWAGAVLKGQAVKPDRLPP